MAEFKRFVSALGPDKPSGLSFFRSVRHFSEAITARRSILEQILSNDPGYDVVIYRVSYDGERFYSSRQLELEGKGDERWAGEPHSLQEMAFDLLSAPRALIESKEVGPEGMSKLSSEVLKIYDMSHMPSPGTLRP